MKLIPLIQILFLLLFLYNIESTNSSVVKTKVKIHTDINKIYDANSTYLNKTIDNLSTDIVIPKPTESNIIKPKNKISLEAAKRMRKSSLRTSIEVSKKLIKLLLVYIRNTSYYFYFSISSNSNHWIMPTL